MSNKKYLQFAKSRKKTTLTIDLQQLATEYSKLLNKRFCYVFSGGAKIQFQFKMENFYHLLGFHKLTDVTVVKLVEDHRLKKEDFYKYVKDGKITMDSTDSSIVGEDVDKILNIQDSTKKSDLGEIKTHRFQFFSELNLLELLKNDPVIDFEVDACDTLIEADKVFFKLIAEKNRNLNLFIGYDNSCAKHFVSTFFVEMEKDKFLKKQTGEQQPLLKILSREVIDTQNNATIDFFIKWHNVRDEFKEEAFYRGQKRLKTWINSKHILSTQVEDEISIQRGLVEQYSKDLEQLRVRFAILELLEQLSNPEKKEEAQLELMEYNIDSENIEDIKQYSQYDLAQVKTEKINLENKLKALESKLQNHEKFLPDIKEMELQEVLKAYQIYISDVQLERERVRKIIESQDIFANTLSPRDFKKAYDECK